MARFALAPHSMIPAAAPGISSSISSSSRCNLSRHQASSICFRTKFSPRRIQALRPRFTSYTCSVQTLVEAQSVSITPESLSQLPATQGVYAVYDKQGELQFVGMSRRISSSVQGHARDLPDLCGSVKVATLENSDVEGLKQAWQAWVEEHIKESGKIPPGNAPGNKTWTVKRRPKNDLKMKPSRNKELTITLEQLIDQVVKTHLVVIFIKGSRTAPQCGFSHRVLTILEQQGVEYESVNVLDEDHNFGVREAVKSYSQWPTIPQVFVKGEFIGGADLLTEMAESGELSKLFDKLKTSS